MKKVLFVATITRHVVSFHVPYLQMFKEKGYEVHVASKGEEEIKYCDKHFNIPFERFPLNPKNLKSYKELKKIINDNQYSIIHCHTPVGGVITRLAARKARKQYNTKVIYTAHGFHFYKGAPLLNWIIYYPIEKICSKWTDCLITITNEDFELAKRKFKKCKQIEHVCGVGLNTDRFDIEITEEDLEELRKEIGIEKDNIVLTYVAELNKNKNQMLLIKTMEQLIKKSDKYRLILVGDGNKKQEYEQYIIEHNLQEYIKILGRREDVPQILKLTNIYVASSLREGLPVNIMEAMYMGLPVIATDNRGHRELVENEINGFIVKNQKELKESIEEILRAKQKYKVLSQENRKRSKEYVLDKIQQQMKQIYRRMEKLKMTISKEKIISFIIKMFYIVIILGFISDRVNNLIGKYLMFMLFFVNIILFIFCKIEVKKSLYLYLIPLMIIIILFSILSLSGIGSYLNLLNLILLIIVAQKVKLKKREYKLIVALSCILLLILFFKSIFVWKNFELNKEDINPNVLAQSIILSFGIVYTGIKQIRGEIKSKRILLVLNFMAILAIYFCNCRTALVSIMIFIITQLFENTTRYVNNNIKKILSMLIVIGISIPIIYVYMYENNVDIKIPLISKSLYTGREILWKSMIDSLNENKMGYLIGLGSHNMTSIGVIKNLHNWYLGMIYLFGIPLTISYYVFLMLNFEKIKNVYIKISIVSVFLIRSI
jgi:glycosyltransferase EpsD